MADGISPDKRHRFPAGTPGHRTTDQAHGWAAGGRAIRIAIMTEQYNGNVKVGRRGIVGRYVSAMGALGTCRQYIGELTGRNRRLRRWVVVLAIALAGSIAMHIWGAIR